MFQVLTSPSALDIDPNAYLYVDTETIGLYGRIRLVQMFQSHWSEVAIFDAFQTPLEEIVEALKKAPLVFHNGIYDLSCLRNEGFVIDAYDDTFLLGRLQYPELETFSLDSMLEAALGFCPYTKHGIVKANMQKAKWDSLLLDTNLEYAAIDVFYLPKLMAEVYGHLDSLSYKLDIATAKEMLKFSKVGIPVNKDILEAERESTRLKISEFEAKHPNIKPNSAPQMKKLLNVDSTNDRELANLASHGDTMAQDIRDWRKAIKKLNFIKRFDKPRIYGNFNVATRSGRSNCSDENLQQIPSSLKHIFQTEKYFVYADFSNLELRTFCAMVGESVMERMFRDDVDLHTFTAHKLFKVPMEQVSKQQRQIAKTFNFSSLYGAGVPKRLDILVATTGISLELEEGYTLAKEWNNTYPNVKVWQEHNSRMWQAGETGFTALRRPYLAKLYTDFGNLQIQGSGAEVAKLALVKMLKELDANKLCAFIHDSYTFEVETFEEAQHYAEVLAKTMQWAWFYVSKYFKIKDLPMPVLASVGKNWKDLQSDTNLLYTYEV